MQTLTLCGGLSGLFVDFDLLPDLGRSGEGTAEVARWSTLLEATGFDARTIEPSEVPARSPLLRSRRQAHGGLPSVSASSRRGR